MNSDGGWKIFKVSSPKEAESEYQGDHFIGSSISIQWPKCYLKLLEYLFRKIIWQQVCGTSHSNSLSYIYVWRDKVPIHKGKAAC
jgi:hypothetical protein